MVTLYPEFDIDNLTDAEVILIIDCSNSMQGGSAFEAAKQVIIQ